MWQYIYTNELYHHGILGQKWGVRRFQNEDGTRTTAGKQREKLTRSIYRMASKKEPVITKDVTEAIISSGGKMYGLEHRLKTERSIGRKIHTNSLEKNISQEDAAGNIKDAVRYTSICSDKQFVDSYNKTKSNLQQKGYEEIRCRNYFDMYNKGLVKHKSVQSVYADPDGYLFEIQFQTPSSQKAKDLKVPLYERARTPGISNSKKKQLEFEMDALAKRVSTPDGINKIKSHG